MVYRPSTPFENVTFIAVDQFRNQGTVLNGTDLGITTDTGVLTEIYSGAPITLESLCFYDKVADTGGFRIIQIAINNGTPFMLVDNKGEDYDLMQDSPTQNFATLNPLINTNWGPNGNSDEETIYEAANLRARHSGSNSVLSNTTQYIENIYFEVGPTLGANERNYPSIIGFDLEDYWTRDTADMFNVLNTGALRIPGQDTTTVFDPWFQNDIARVTFNGSTRVLSIAVNDGAFINRDLSAFIPAGTRIGIGLQVFNFDGTGCINYGQQPLKYEVPAGFSVSQTQNMPEATITDGRDHFQAITGPGQGPSGDVAGQLAGAWSLAMAPNPMPGGFETIAGTGPADYGRLFDGSELTFCQPTQANSFTFTPPGGIAYNTLEVLDAGCLYNLNGAGFQPAVTPNDWTALDSNPGTLNTLEFGSPSGTIGGAVRAIRINGDTVLIDLNILAVAQQTFPNGLWWIKDRVNSNQHQLVDSVRGGNLAIRSPNLGAQIAYVAPAGDSAAWCWNAPDAWASTDAGVTAGTIASSGRRNLAAGFSIIQYTGNGTAGATIGHALNEAPEFFIIKKYGTDNTQLYVYTSTVGNQSAVFLNSNGDAVADSNIYWNSQSPSNTVITLGVVGDTNGNGDDHICYAWHSVPGYSAFGGYVGNGDQSGPFIALSFRPAFVMVKRATGGAGNWQIMDTTINPTNPANIWIEPNEPTGEQTGNAFIQEDFLCNGFKPRGGASQQDNLNGETYIYAAFAENPFGGSNVSPANAR